MDDYLAKPIHPRELERVLADLGAPAVGTGAACPSVEADLLDPTVVARLRSDFDDDTRRRLVDLFLDHFPDSMRRAARGGRGGRPRRACARRRTASRARA